MIEAKAPPETIRRVYDLWSTFYGAVAGPFEHKPRMIGLERARIEPHDKVLEVAVGPGLTLVEILKRVDSENVVYGVDLSSRMLAKAQRLVNRRGFDNVDLQEADARHLPFEDNTFDMLFNSFMLDLIRLADMPTVLSEFWRVLKPAGRLVLVNLSKSNEDTRPFLERLYELCPSNCVPYLLGGCRPVVMERLVEDAGFVEIDREFLRYIMPSEIVIAKKARSPKTTVASRDNAPAG
jgi:demethylmenaquinone methyltransferase/2-methoxy-6-polyprenyl-1,4-benzoquinol methylase